MELGETVTDDQLEECKRLVKPDFAMHHIFTSVSVHDYVNAIFIFGIHKSHVLYN